MSLKIIAGNEGFLDHKCDNRLRAQLLLWLNGDKGERSVKYTGTSWWVLRNPGKWRLPLEDGGWPGWATCEGDAPSPRQRRPEHPPYLRSIPGPPWALGAQTLGLSGFYDHLPPHSILPYLYLLSIFRITLSRPGNAFNSRLSLTPGCLPTPLRSPWNCRRWEGGQGCQQPLDQYVGVKGALPRVSLCFGAESAKSARGAPGSLQVLQPEGHSAGAQQPSTGRSAPCRRWPRSPGSPGAWSHLRLCCDRLAAAPQHVLSRGAGFLMRVLQPSRLSSELEASSARQ